MKKMFTYEMTFCQNHSHFESLINIIIRANYLSQNLFLIHIMNQYLSIFWWIFSKMIAHIGSQVLRQFWDIISLLHIMMSQIKRFCPRCDRLLQHIYIHVRFYLCWSICYVKTQKCGGLLKLWSHGTDLLPNLLRLGWSKYGLLMGYHSNWRQDFCIHMRALMALEQLKSTWNI